MDTYANSLKNDTISGKQFMHRVVLWTFHGPPPDDLKKQCDHQNRVRDDNCLSNLQ